MGWTVQGLYPSVGSFQTHPDQCAAHPSSYTMGTWSFLGVKQPGHSIYQPPLSSAKVKE